jgi:N-acylneuraminate cytidylyltransferase/CMP-N,N'-diacetyllegionaminic acid synthase
MALDDIAVSSDSEEVLAIARMNKLNNLFQRPAELATSSASKWLTWRHLVDTYEQENDAVVEYLVDLDVTTPLRKPHHVAACIAEAKSNDRDLVITCYPSDRNPYFNMMERKKDGLWQVVSQTSQPIENRQNAPAVLSLTPAVYVVSRHALYTYDHWSLAQCALVEIERENAIDIDTEYDFRLIEFLVENNLAELPS